MKLEIETLSIVAGSEACNARCPFCVSKMTPPDGITLKEPAVNWRNFRKACVFAKTSGVNTAMITGKGEPTLFPDQITQYMDRLSSFEFPFIELQTNGIPIAQNWDRYLKYLKNWYNFGMTTIAISNVGFDSEKNRQIYLPYKKEYIDLPNLIKDLHREKFSVRLTTVLLNKFIDSPKKLEGLITFAKENRVEQLTIKPVVKPEKSLNDPVYDWTDKHHLKPKQVSDMVDYLNTHGTKLREMFYGATIYDVEGQNVCLTNCLTINSDKDPLRQIIFFPDGHIKFAWQYEGAILL